MTTRPLIAIPSRFSSSASALRYAAEVGAAALLEAVYEAGGEPLLVHPARPSDDGSEIAHRMRFADGVLLPGGGDVAASHYGAEHHEALYDVDEVQDAFDFAIARWAWADHVPLLAICRGLQVVNVSLGGTLEQDMKDHHRHVVSELSLSTNTRLHSVTGNDTATISCFHHQSIARLGEGLVVAARTSEGVIEAVEAVDSAGWFLGVQWHPEDTAAADVSQANLFAALVEAAVEFRMSRV